MMVFYGGLNDTSPDVQFSCLKTFERDGDPRADPLKSAAAAGPGVALSILAALLGLGIAVL